MTLVKSSQFNYGTRKSDTGRTNNLRRAVQYHCSKCTRTKGGENDDSKHRFYEELEQVFDRFPKHDMIILLEDFNANVGRENVFKVTIENRDYNDNAVRIVNFDTS